MSGIGHFPTFDPFFRPGYCPAVILELARSVGTLALLAGVGFLAFRHPVMQRRAFPIYLTAILQLLFPFYFVVRISSGWGETAALGWPLLVVMFLLCPAMLLVQGRLARRVAGLPAARVREPGSYVLLAAIQNAGFIPLPILERIAPDAVIVAMFFYLLAFNLAFWTVAIPIVRSGHVDLRGVQLRLNPPLVGLALGILLGATGLVDRVPPAALEWGNRIGRLALDGALVALGGALAGIREPLTVTREQWVFAGWRLVAYPVAVLGVAALPWPGLDGPLGWGIRVALVLQAAAPPATQTLVVTRAYGNDRQLHYTAGMVLFSYLVVLVTIPVLVAAAGAAFR